MYGRYQKELMYDLEICSLDEAIHMESDTITKPTMTNEQTGKLMKPVRMRPIQQSTLTRSIRKKKDTVMKNLQKNGTWMNGKKITLSRTITTT